MNFEDLSCGGFFCSQCSRYFVHICVQKRAPSGKEPIGELTMLKEMLYQSMQRTVNSNLILNAVDPVLFMLFGAIPCIHMIQIRYKTEI